MFPPVPVSSLLEGRDELSPMSSLLAKFAD